MNRVKLPNPASFKCQNVNILLTSLRIREGRAFEITDPKGHTTRIMYSANLYHLSTGTGIKSTPNPELEWLRMPVRAKEIDVITFEVAA